MENQRQFLINSLSRKPRLDFISVLLDHLTIKTRPYRGTDDTKMTDVATPITRDRYTGNWRGSYEGCVRRKRFHTALFNAKDLARFGELLYGGAVG